MWGGGGRPVVQTFLENNMLLYVSLEIMVRTPSRTNVTHGGPHGSNCFSKGVGMAICEIR